MKKLVAILMVVAVLVAMSVSAYRFEGTPWDSRAEIRR